MWILNLLRINKREPTYIRLRITVPKGMNEMESDQFNNDVAVMLAEMSSCHVELGGTGLKIVEISQ